MAAAFGALAQTGDNVTIDIAGELGGESIPGFDPSLVTSTVVSWTDAEAALAHPPLKLVIARDAG